MRNKNSYLRDKQQNQPWHALYPIFKFESKKFVNDKSEIELIKKRLTKTQI